MSEATAAAALERRILDLEGGTCHIIQSMREMENLQAQGIVALAARIQVLEESVARMNELLAWARSVQGYVRSLLQAALHFIS